MPTHDAKFQVLYDHYKDTFSHIREYLKLRDWLFIFILAVLTLMAFQVISPQESGEAISQFLAKKLELNKSIDVSFVGSIIWFSLLSLILRYFQVTTLVERQYTYIQSIEAQIGKNYNAGVFTREGKSYLANYPLFSEWTWLLYTVIFPVLLVAVSTIKIGGEILHRTSISIPLIFN